MLVFRNIHLKKTLPALLVSFTSVLKPLPTLPKGEEDDRFDCQELEHRFKGPQKVAGGGVEEEQSIEGQTHRDVVDDRNVEVASIHAIGTHVFWKKCFAMFILYLNRALICSLIYTHQ